MDHRVRRNYRRLPVLIICMVLTLSFGAYRVAAQETATSKVPMPDLDKGTKAGPDLVVTPADLRIENSNAGGYILYIRKKADISSVLLTESTEEPDHSLASYAMRSKDPNPINAGEKRRLNGAFLPQNQNFLITSTAIDDKTFGKAFRIFIPYVIDYGYSWARNGTRQIIDGSFISIRTFALPFADYDGAYQDNPYKLKITQAAPVDPPDSRYNKETDKAFSQLAGYSNDKVTFSKGADELLKDLGTVLDKVDNPEVDLVLCLDATGSMEPYVPFIKKDLVPLLKKFVETHKKARFSFTQYRDYFEEFLYQTSPFVSDFELFQRAINHYRALGGGDIPEAVDEALYGTLTSLDWKASERIIVLVGDAPPHPVPLGKITHDMVEKAAESAHVRILPIVLPSLNPANKP